MMQYMAMEEIVIRNKNGEIRKVKDFRKRVKYDPKFILIDKLRDSEVMRVDTLAFRVYNDPLNVGAIIDVNVTDVFSLVSGNRVDYVNPSKV